MTESSYVMLQAREILATPSHERLAKILIQFSSLPKDSDEYESARAVYSFCVSDFPNCLTLKLLAVYRLSSKDFIRLLSIILLSNFLTRLKAQRIELSFVALQEIKPLVVSCLMMRKAINSDDKIVRIFGMIFDNGGCEELSDCVLSLANSDPIRAFEIFIDMPSHYGEFINRFQEKFLDEVYNVLIHPEEYGVEDWILALKSGVKMGIELIGSEKRVDLTKDILKNVVKSADAVLRNGMEEEFLQQGLESLEKFLAKESDLCKWNRDQCRFVEEFVFRISGSGTLTKKIYQMVTKQDKYVHNPAFKLSSSLVESSDFYNNLKAYSSVAILRKVESTEMDDGYREVAVIRIHDLLCDHTSRKEELDVSEIRELQPLLISCLGKTRIPESTFKILGQVVFHVAHELFSYQEDYWVELWDYIATDCKTEFKKKVYIFQCLTMRIDDKKIVIHALDKLLPEIHSRLNPPRKLLLDDISCWVLAFTGAFCAVIHLIEISSHTESAKEILDKMTDSARELVEREMQAELVNRALIDMESIVEKQFRCYTTNGYRFVKVLVLRLNTVNGMSMESKTVLWRINENLEKFQEMKVIPKSELDWLNQPET